MHEPKRDTLLLTNTDLGGKSAPPKLKSLNPASLGDRTRAEVTYTVSPIKKVPLAVYILPTMELRIPLL